MRFGEFIRAKRLEHPNEYTGMDVANALGISRSYLSEVEGNRKKPPDYKYLIKLAEFLNLTEDEAAMMYDLASRDNGEVPYDIADTFMYEEVGNLARVALRKTQAGFIDEEDWKKFIREAEKKRRESEGGDIND